MRSQRNLFIVTALIEAPGGLAMASLPAVVIGHLLGVQEPSPEALIFARLSGAALFTIGIACWLARDDRGSRSQYALLWAILIYNVGAAAVLALAGSVLATADVTPWLGAGLHALMTIWCAVNLPASAANARGTLSWPARAETISSLDA